MLRMLRDMHDMLQPMPHEVAKGGQGPILPKFNRPAQSASPSPPAPIAPPPPERTMLIGPDGEEYVEGRLPRAGVRANGFGLTPAVRGVPFHAARSRPEVDPSGAIGREGSSACLSFRGGRVRRGARLPRSQSRKRAKQRHALLLNCGQGLQRIGEAAAAGHPEAFGPMLRILELTADAMARAKDEKGYGSSPLMSRIVSDDADPPAPPELTKREPAVIDKNGVPSTWPTEMA